MVNASPVTAPGTEDRCRTGDGDAPLANRSAEGTET
jgi:hypothetical protein